MALTDNIVLYWTLDDADLTSDDPDDVSSNGNDGVNTNAAATGATGLINEAFTFDGTNEYIKINSSLLLGNAMTLSFWANFATVTDFDWIFRQGVGGSDRSIDIFFSTDAKIKFSYSTTSASSYATEYLEDAASSFSGWTHIVITRDGTTHTLYINGSSKAWTLSSGSDSTNNFRNPTTDEMKFFGLSTNGMDAGVDEVGVWNVALSSSDVTTLYNAGAGLSYPFNTGTNLQLNISDAWKTVSAMQINIGDAWKSVAGAQINIGDAWKTIF